MAHDDFKGGDIPTKMQHANDNLLMIAQIETEEGLRNIDEIAAVDGIDALWIGQFDLTVSMGIPGKFDHPKYVEATKRLLDTCRRHKKIAVQGGQDPDQLAAAPAEGYRMIVYVADLWIYQRALRSCFKKIREKI
jgi:2-dehydro-3-deoxyglucarate aldolase/4-hydroxy-2-oxoheptanedioate aldolase